MKNNDFSRVETESRHPSIRGFGLDLWIHRKRMWLLEIYPKGTHVTYPYLEYHYDRVLGRHTLLRYYITGNEFLRTGIYVEK
jgi:hypothetical protein